MRKSIGRLAGGLSSGYMALWRELKGWRLFLFYVMHYTLLFMVLQRVVLGAFVESGTSFAWLRDGAAQSYARLVYIRQIWKEGLDGLLAGKGWHLPQYDFRSGPVLFDTQIGLPQLFAIFWPGERFDAFYNLYALSNLYWMGITFSMFGFYWNMRPLPVLTGAVSYAFSGMAVYADIWHPHIAVPMVFLPLLLIGAERILREERAFIFVLAVFLSLTTQFGVYMSCMQAVFVALYVAVRFFDVYPSDRPRQALRLLGRLLIWGGVPVLLAAASWLPALLEIADSGRVGNALTLQENMLFYDRAYYAGFLGQFLLDMSEVGNWNHLGFSVLTLPAIAVLFVRRRKGERGMRLLFLLMTAMLCIPAVAYVMSGFSNISNRFCFGYAFCTAAILMFMLPRFSSLMKREAIMAGTGLAAYCAVAAFFGLRGHFDARPVVILLGAVALMGLCFALGARGGRLMLAALAITCLSVCYTGWWFFDARGNVSQFYPSPDRAVSDGQYASLGDSQAVAQDGSFFRVAGDRISNSEINMAFHYGLNGLTMYPYYGWSNAYVRWLEEMEIPREDVRHSLNCRAVNAAALALRSVKYYASRATVSSVRPYGFVEVESVKKGDVVSDVILRNENALPIGYAYDKYMTRDDYERLNGLGKQEAQLQAVLLEDAPSLPGLERAQVELTARQIPYEITTDGVSWEDGLLFAEREEATMTLTFSGLPGSETYLRIVDHVPMNDESWMITAHAGDTSVSAMFYTDTYVYAHRQHTQALNLGYSEEGITQITLSFPFASLWRLGNLEVWCQPMDGFAARTAALGEEALQNVETDWHSLRGDITVGGDRVLTVAIPYTDGWSAYVDGKRTALVQANTGFMALELTEGTHEVELRYALPGLRAGLAMSAAGAVGLALLIASRGKRKRSAAG